VLTKALVLPFELLLENTPSTLFVSGEFPKPFLHFGMAKVYAKATLNYLGDAASCRQERIKICECPMPISVSKRTRGLQSDIDPVRSGC
jgi:hypothetical protein